MNQGSGNNKKEENNKNKKVLYQEPVDACLGTEWYLFVFKDEQIVSEVALDQKSCYQLGRDADYSDIHLAHESCSKHHAVLQFRDHTQLFRDENQLFSKGSNSGPNLFLMDLNSTHGTFLNDARIEPMRFYQVMSKDHVRFAASSRDYLLLHNNSNNE